MLLTFWFNIFLSILLASIKSGITSRITFQDGRYNDIVIALHPDTDPNICQDIIGNITEIFKEAGSHLYSSTNGEAQFGSINILLPSDWITTKLEKCVFRKSEIIPAKVYQTYESADFKVSSTHPFAKTLPWTKQYKGCENESETVYLPLEFLMNSIFSLDTKGKLLVHEWTKFRYGVFEEFGFFDDPFFSPCYVRGGKQYYTSCTNTKFDTIASNSPQLTPETCRTLVAENLSQLTANLKRSNSSLLFAPHFDNIQDFCSNVTHNGLAPTKQNVFCERKSVSDVIFSHKDFKRLSEHRFFPNNRIPRPGSSPTVHIIQQLRSKNPGYVFIIENTSFIREFGRLDHVKQGIAPMIQMAIDKTEVALYRYNGAVNSPIAENTKNNLGSENNRIRFLMIIPSNSTNVTTSFESDRYPRTRFSTDTPLDWTFWNVLNALIREENVRWNLILVTSMPPINIEGALNLISTYDYPLSILTFDNSKDWLQFNTIPNTEKIIFLPHCFKENNICHGKTSSLISDHLLELISSKEEITRHFHKVLDINIKELAGVFKIDSIVENGYEFVLHFPVYNTLIKLQVEPPFPSGRKCSSSEMLGYDGMLEIKDENCPYQTGEWRYSIENHPPNLPINYNLRGYVETQNTERDLFISSTTTHKNELEVFPTMSRYPIYVSVMSKKDQPIIGASVELQVEYEGGSFEQSNLTILYDNGIDPDLTADDGIYSNFFTTFNSNASYHTLQVHVQTKLGSSKAIKTLRLDTYEAALLDPKMSSKCCGSKIPYQETIDIGYAYYTLTLPSFRTGENIEPGMEFNPPSKIYTPINIIEENTEYVIYEFMAPGSNNSVGRVKHYSLCCTLSESGNLDDNMCQMIEIENCLPVEANLPQSCKIFISDLIETYFNETIPEIGSTLFCGFRGVNNAGNNGPISSYLVDILLIPEDDDFRASPSDCVVISDGCLPIEIFWGLIACIGGLILILFIVLICWCCTTKDTKKEKLNDNSHTFISGENRRSSSPEALRNVYINQAYIQDSEGQLRLVASDGQLFPTPITGVNDKVAIPEVRRRSISANDISPGQNQTYKTSYPSANNVNNNPDLKHVSWNANNEIELEDTEKHMPVFFTPRKAVVAGNTFASRPSSETSALPLNMPSQYFLSTSNPGNSILSNNEVLETGRNTNIKPRGENSNTPMNKNFNRINNRTNVPAMSSNNIEPGTGPIYASVQRFGRKPLKTTIEPLNVHNLPSTTRGTGQFSPAHSKSATFNKDPTVIKYVSGRVSPIGSSEKPDGFTQDYTIQSRPPVQMDHFPSSESEAYSDMSHILPRLAIIMNKPPIPPPVPMSEVPSRNIDKQSMKVPPTPMARTPSRENILNDNKTSEMNRSRSFPPPPPPPRQFRNNPNPGEEEDEYDDDSDNWDNYDEFEFSPPGTSYA